MEVIHSYPGKIVNLTIAIEDGYGQRVDITPTPSISKVIFPNMLPADNFPANMTKLQTGVYFYQLLVPLDVSSIGSFIVETNYKDPKDNIDKIQMYQIVIKPQIGIAGGYTAGL